MPPQRLIDLVQAGDIQSARMLARGILKNDDVLNVKFRNNYIIIETENFIGKHKTKTVDMNETMINPEGKYDLKSNEVNYNFICHTIDKKLLAKIYSQINSMDSFESENIELNTESNNDKNKPDNQQEKLDKRKTMLTKIISYI